MTDDVVIGVVASRHAENYKVDVGTSSLVQLDALAFDGASKRNKPNLQVGDVVYARVILVRDFFFFFFFSFFLSFSPGTSWLPRDALLAGLPEAMLPRRFLF